MSTDLLTAADEVVYPDSDGKPVADNTLQWDWMVKIVGELREMFAGKDVFVAGDLLWYPVEGDSKITMAPDALVVFGRPPGYRGSYKQWEEGGIAPHVVFEVLSPSNTREEMDAKRRWYDKYGVEEYYFIDPYDNQLLGWTRCEGRLEPVYPMKGFKSPRLGIRFDVNGEVRIFASDGREFRTREERVEEILDAFEEQRKRAEQESIAKERLAAKLRELGVNPDDVLKLPG